jgi:hypothetical protein
MWPQSLEDETRMKLALESLENENKGLKEELVVRLSELSFEMLSKPSQQTCR